MKGRCICEHRDTEHRDKDRRVCCLCGCPFFRQEDEVSIGLADGSLRMVPHDDGQGNATPKEAPLSPDSPSQGERKQQLLDQDWAPPARPLTYLASPYGHPDRAVRVARFDAANAAAGKLMMGGHKVFSPISHTHPIAECCGLPLGWDFWEAFDRAYLSHCGRVIVLRSEGWEQSKGIAGELRIAVEMGIHVEYMDPDPLLGNAAIAAPSSPSSASPESGGGTLDTMGAATRKTSNPEER